MKYLIGAIAVLLIFLAGYIVGQRMVDPCPEVKESIEVVKKDIPEVVKVIEKPKPVKSYKTTMAKGTMEDSTMGDSGIMANSCDSIKEYFETMEDSTGKVTVETMVQGSILKQNIKFKPTIRYIKETREVEKPIPQSGLFFGAEIGFSVGRNFRLAPEIEYLTKKGYAYSYNYDLINNIHSVGVKRKVF